MQIQVKLNCSFVGITSTWNNLHVGLDIHVWKSSYSVSNGMAVFANQGIMHFQHEKNNICLDSSVAYIII